jgi:hypothetical protein
MGKTALTKDSEFIVGEEKLLNYIMAFLFLALFMYGFIDAMARKFINIPYLNFIYTLALAPALIFFRKGLSKRIFIRINKTGIYQDEKLLTNWAQFIKAFLTQDQKLISIKDNFVLVVEYRKEGHMEGFRRKIPLTNTQNRSEEEVLEAVRFFWNEYKRELSSRN